LDYWRLTKYSQEDVLAVCREVDTTMMAALLTFTGDGGLNVRLTNKTWERQAGHYPTVIDFFIEAAQSPELRSLQGSVVIWLEDGLWEYQQPHSRRAPMLAFGRHIHDYRTLLIPDPAYLGSLGYADEVAELAAIGAATPWEERLTRVFWRGAATGLGIENENWVHTHRGRLTLLANEIGDPEVLDAKITKARQLSEEQRAVLREAGVMGEEVPFKEFLKYRYQVDADGYCAAWRGLFLKLASQSVVLKMQSTYEQWYFGHLRPWHHYIPLQSNLSDFREVYTWLRHHDEEAKTIAANASELLGNVVTYEASKAAVIETCRVLLSECTRT
jgi:hypothetical protein